MWELSLILIRLSVIGPDKRQFIFVLFLHENISCGYSLEVPRPSVSNEYHNICFLWKNKKNINKNALYLEL